MLEYENSTSVDNTPAFAWIELSSIEEGVPFSSGQEILPWLLFHACVATRKTIVIPFA